MPLSVGERLGPYEILGRIGEGGMGEVWKARDTRLGRTVALKLSKTQFTERFEREARAAAALNHPHICQLHDLGPNYLVLEFVEGTPLKGPLPLEKAVEYAGQILEALDAAHRTGITHRDLKPANILVTKQGIKLLDFGLALFHPGSLPGSEGPTQTQFTQEGLAVGTPAYMAPELWEGKVADARTDIYSFGCVLYEMVTGERVGKELTPVSPPALDRVIKTCLATNPDRRFQNVVDVKHNLAWVLDKPGAAPAKVPWAAALAAAGIVALIAGILVWRGLGSRKPALQPLVRMDVDLGKEVTLGSITGSDQILSPDGTRLVYVSQGRLWSRTLDQAKAAELTGTDGAFAPFFSPDGRWVGFFANGKLKKISVEGGAEIDLCDAPTPRGGSWGEDGSIIATLSVPGALSRIPSAGGAPTPVTELDRERGELTHRWPQILPGGAAVLFTSHTTTGAYDGADVEVVTLADRHSKIILKGGTYGHYVTGPGGAGFLLYVSRGTLFAVRFDSDRLEIRGTPTPILEHVGYNAGSGSAQFDFSPAGTLVYRIGGAAARLVTVQWLESSGALHPLLSKPGYYERPSLSPDGERVALEVTDASNADIWIYEWRRDTMTRLTVDSGGDPGPVWSPDGRYIVFQAPGGMFWTRSDGSAKPQPLTRSKNDQQPWSFSPDGRRLAFMEAAPGAAYHIWTVPVEISDDGVHAGQPEAFLQTQPGERHPKFSPDGRWLAYSSNESGTFQAYVRNFPDQGRRWQVSNNGGLYPEWSGSGRELFFRTEDNRVMVAGYTVKEGAFAADKPRVWSETRLADLGLNLNFTVARDGKRVAGLMAVQSSEEEAAQHHVIFLMNFFDELQRRVPQSSDASK